MNNYIRLTYCLKREISRFSEKICKGLKRPQAKFVTDMLYGISVNQSCHLSEIGRALKEGISLKKTIERLSRNLFGFRNADLVIENYTNIVKQDIDDRTILIIDNSDISKPCSFALEDMCQVWDGSKKMIQKGYHLLEMTALASNHKMPIPVYTRVYSSEEKTFISEDQEILTGLKHLTKQFGRKGIRTLDRGYDALIYYTYFLKHAEPFIIRAKKDRNVIYQGKNENILDVANKFKGKYRIDFKDKHGKTIECKMSIIPVALPKYPDKELSLVVVHGFGKTPLMLLSNLKSDDNRLCKTITKVYLMRWRIEEYYRFKKQQLKFEDFRVRSLNSIRALNLLVTVLIGLFGMFSEKQNESVFVAEIIHISRRIYGTKEKNGKSKFIYYAIADGIFDVLQKTKVGIRTFLNQTRKPMPDQLSFVNFALN